MDPTQTSVVNEAKQYEIETYSGQFVDTSAPDPKTINLEDIAHALAQTCRFGGHCRRFYSVAEHGIFVSQRLERKGYGLTLQLAGLHHDDAEAFLGDIPRPMKPLLGDRYEELSKLMDAAVVKGMALPFETALFYDERIKDADNWSLFVEARFLLPSQGKGWGSGLQGAYRWELELPSRIIVPDYWLDGVVPNVAEYLFLKRHNELIERLTV